MIKPKYYSQYDPLWKDIPYTIDGDANKTISYSGCGPTSMAMILATWNNPKITPIDMCKLAIELKDRTANQGTEWEYFGHVATKYGLKFKQSANINEAIAAIKTGAYIICSMGPGTFTKSGHFILLWNVDDKGRLQVNDPASMQRSLLTYDQGVFIKECREYFIFYPPAAPVVKSTKTMKTTVDLNVRKGPGTTYDVIDTFKANTAVEVISVTNGWATIIYSTTEAFVSAKYLK